VGRTRGSTGSIYAVSYCSAIKPALCNLPFGAWKEDGNSSVLATPSTPSTSSTVAFLAASRASLRSAKHPTKRLVAVIPTATPGLGFAPSAVYVLTSEKVLMSGPWLVTVYTGAGSSAFEAVCKEC
jgi:hypothetical protein